MPVLQLAPDIQHLPDEIELTKSQIIELWELGILSNLAYIYLAIKIDGKEDVYPDSFIENWRGTLNADSGKAKKLTRRQVLQALVVLEDKQAIDLHQDHIQLSFKL